MGRVNWICPGCKKVLKVADATDLVLCPECRVEPDVKPRKKQTSTWSTSDIAFVGIGSTVVLGIALLVANAFWTAVPKFDPDRLLVETWLKENLEDGQWDEVKWFPVVKPQNLYDLNLLHIIQSMEKAKTAYENGLGGSPEDLVEIQKHYRKYRETGIRAFCEMKFRVTTLNGQAKSLRSQVFEITNGVAKPLPGNNIVEFPSAPTRRSGQPIVMYDALRFFEDPDYDPFPVIPSENFEERAQAAMIWQEPKTPAIVTPPVEPKRQPVVAQQIPPVVVPNVAVTSSKPVAVPQNSIPPNIRAYFDRAMDTQSAEVKKLEKRVADFNGRLRSAKKLEEKTALKERIRQTEDAIAELKRVELSSFLPDRPSVGDIGSLQAVEVIGAINDETLIVRWLPNGKGRPPQIVVAIHPIPTEEAKTGDESINADLFKVTASKGEPSDLMKSLKDAGKLAEYVVEPIEKQEIEKWRDQYEKIKKK